MTCRYFEAAKRLKRVSSPGSLEAGQAASRRPARAVHQMYWPTIESIHLIGKKHHGIWTIICSHPTRA